MQPDFLKTCFFQQPRPASGIKAKVYSSFGFSKCGLKAQWSTKPRASEAAPWVSRVGAVAP